MFCRKECVWKKGFCKKEHLASNAMKTGSKDNWLIFIYEQHRSVNIESMYFLEWITKVSLLTVRNWLNTWNMYNRGMKNQTIKADRPFFSRQVTVNTYIISVFLSALFLFLKNLYTTLYKFSVFTYFSPPLRAFSLSPSLFNWMSVSMLRLLKHPS